MGNVIVGSIEVIDGSSYFSFNLERGYKYFEYVEKVEKVFKFFDDLIGRTKDGDSMMTSVLGTPMYAKVKFNCIDSAGKSLSYEIASDMRTIKEKIKHEGKFYYEIVHHGNGNGVTAHTKTTHYVNNDLTYNEVQKMTFDEVNEMMDCVKKLLKTRIVYSTYELQSVDKNQNTLALLKVHNARDLGKGQNLNVLVSFSDIYNAQINSAVIGSEAMDKSLSKRIFTELAESDVKVRLLGFLTGENN